jgi:hypothetical protein
MEPGILSYFEWISSNLQAGDKIGVDPSQISAGNLINLISFSRLQKQINLFQREES